MLSSALPPKSSHTPSPEEPSALTEGLDTLTAQPHGIAWNGWTEDPPMPWTQALALKHPWALCQWSWRHTLKHWQSIYPLLLAPVLVELILAPLDGVLITPNTPAFFWVYGLVCLIHLTSMAGWLGILSSQLEQVLTENKVFRLGYSYERASETLLVAPSSELTSSDGGQETTPSFWQGFVKACQAFFEGVGRYLIPLLGLITAGVLVVIAVVGLGATLKGINLHTMQVLGAWLLKSVSQWMQWLQLWQENHTQFNGNVSIQPQDATKELLKGILQQVQQAILLLSGSQQKALSLMAQLILGGLGGLWLLQQLGIATVGTLTMPQGQRRFPMFFPGLEAFFQSILWAGRYPKVWLVLFGLSLGLSVLSFLLSKLPLFGFIIGFLFAQWLTVCTMTWVALLPTRHIEASGALGHQVNVEV
ncbi:MAG: hypothetical protein ACKO37_06995 [Vampirovibrionales bacterium]